MVVTVRRRRPRVLAVAAMALVGLAGCGGGESGDDDGDGGDGEPGATVTIVDSAFQPTALTVPAGTEVEFSNTDSISHTATADDGSFDLQLGASVGQTVTLDTAGSVPYHCEIHPGMTAEIVVE